jgi:hypothetical protein
MGSTEHRRAIVGFQMLTSSHYEFPVIWKWVKQQCFAITVVKRRPETDPGIAERKQNLPLMVVFHDGPIVKRILSANDT